jgi:hypothetical protein
MRRATICLLVMVLGSWVASAGQDASVKGIRYPRIVAKLNLYDLSSEKSGAVFTPKSTGVYRFSGEIVPYKNGASWGLETTWTDRSGSYKAVSCPSTCEGGWPEFLEMTIRVSKNATIQYSTYPISGEGSGRYDLFIVVEQLE